MILAAPVIYFMHSFSYANDRKILFRNSLYFIGLLALSVGLHEIISLSIRSEFSVTTRYHTIDDFYGGEFFKNYHWITACKETIALLIGHRWYIGYVTGIVLILSLVTLVRSIWPHHLRMWLVVCLGIAVLAPFAMVLLTGHIWPARTLMAVPILLAGLIYLALQRMTGRLRWIMIGMLVLCLGKYTVSNTQLFYADYVTWQYDQRLVDQIVARAQIEMRDNMSSHPHALVTSGIPEISLPYRKQEENFGGSIFAWGGGSSNRIVALMRLQGYNFFRTPTSSEITMSNRLAENMPRWPLPGSIAVQEKILIVKF